MTFDQNDLLDIKHQRLKKHQHRINAKHQQSIKRQKKLMKKTLLIFLIICVLAIFVEMKVFLQDTDTFIDAKVAAGVTVPLILVILIAAIRNLFLYRRIRKLNNKINQKLKDVNNGIG